MMNKQFSVSARQPIQILSRATQKFMMQCRGCGKTVDLVTFAEASAIVGASVDKLVSCAATGVIHLSVRPEAMLICLNSLLAIDFDSLPKAFVSRDDQRRMTGKSC